MIHEIWELSPDEYLTINNITAKCNTCGWKANGSIRVEKDSGYMGASSELFSICGDHHVDTHPKDNEGNLIKGSFSFHNQFKFFSGDEYFGFGSVSSSGANGIYLKELE